jgi:hypothetical protein
MNKNKSTGGENPKVTSKNLQKRANTHQLQIMQAVHFCLALQAPPVQLPQQPTPTLLRLLSRIANARGNPAYQGPGLPGPNFPGFGSSRLNSFSSVDSGTGYDAAAGGFGAPGSNQPYQLPERFRHYLDSDPLQLPNFPEQQQQQQQQGYSLESAQLDASQQQQQQQQGGGNTPEISSLLAKLNGRGRKFGTSLGGVSHEMVHASIPRMESAPLGPPTLDDSAKQQLAQQPGVLTVGSRYEAGAFTADAATEQLLAELQGLDPETAKQQFQSLLNKVGGRSASVSEVMTRKQYVPRKKATPLAPGGSFTANSSSSNDLSSSWQGSSEGAWQHSEEQQQQDLLHGRDGRSAYGSTVTDNVVLADPREIDRDAGKSAAAAAAAQQPVEVDILQVDRATFNALEQETPRTYDQIQDKAAAVAAAAANADPLFYSNRSKLQPVQQQKHKYEVKDEVIVPVGLANHLLPTSNGLGAAGSGKGAKRGLNAGAATGIALGAFAAVLIGAGIMLYIQAKKMDQEVDSGYTPTAQSDSDVELANQKPPAVCVSPAVSIGGATVSMGGATVSMGGATVSTGGAAAAAAGPDRRFTRNGSAHAAAAGSDEATQGTSGSSSSSSSDAGWLKDLRAACSNATASIKAAAAVVGGRSSTAAAAAAPVTQPPSAAGDIRRFTLTSE